MIHRRTLLAGLGSLIAAPAIVRAGSLMPVKSVPVPVPMTSAEILARYRGTNALLWLNMDAVLEAHYQIVISRGMVFCANGQSIDRQQQITPISSASGHLIA